MAVFTTQRRCIGSKAVLKITGGSAVRPAARFLILEPIPCLEYPSDQSEANHEKAHRHSQADADADIGGAVKTPAKAADQVHDGIEEAEYAPRRRQHVDGIKSASQKRKRRDDQHRDELQMLESLCPDADDESEQAEVACRHHQEG